MQKLILSLIATLLFLNLHGQFQYPVKWESEWKQVSATEYDIIIKGSIDPGWNIYSQYLESDDGPIATQLNFEAGDHFESVGKTAEEGTIKKGYDKIFEMNVTKIFDQAVFTQRVNVSDIGPSIKGYLTYMICDAEQCLPPTDYEFELQLANNMAAEVTDNTIETADIEKSDLAIPSTDLTVPDLGGMETTGTEETNGNPVTWTTAIEKLEGDLYQIQLIANFNKPWTLYSQVIEGDGPIPTTFTFEEGGHYELVGTTAEKATKIKDGFDKTFEIDVKKFVEGPAIFTQQVKVSDPSKPIAGDLVFMTCDDEMCLPPAYQFFQFDVEKLSGKISSEPFEAATEAIVDVPEAIQTLYGTLTPPDLETPLASCQTEAPAVQKSSLWKIFSLGFLGGLIALLTPCIFPMIPLTVSFFTKRSQTRSKGINTAVVYGGFIVLVYLLLSIPFHLLTTVSPDILNQISTNIWLNLAFFFIFIVFELSFFGYFELTLPASWTNKTSQAEGIGGIVGIFFMALTLALVSFSCTGPILGTLLVGALSSDGGAWQLTAGMGGFGLGLALPFGFFAAFPGFMNALPKSGGWLNTVKVTLGFLELALALKFLSNADMVKHWGILKVELFLGLWILIFAG
ncbi:MAG: cytochrome c biogenesis protein CcdA, partial [Bacteroidota bacterium]